MVDGVVLLHGIARTSSSMRVMARMLDAAGYRILNLGYASRRSSLEQLSDTIHPEIAGFAATLKGSLHLVTHSMGGLLARVYIAAHRPARLGRVVMLGPPNEGSAMADMLAANVAYRFVFGPAGQQLTTLYAPRLHSLCGPIDYELGIIAGSRSLDPFSSVLILREPNDGKVTVRSTRLDGMADHIVLAATHPLMTRNPAVIAQTIYFLREGHFHSPSDAPALDSPSETASPRSSQIAGVSASSSGRPPPR